MKTAIVRKHLKSRFWYFSKTDCLTDSQNNYSSKYPLARENHIPSEIKGPLLLKITKTHTPIWWEEAFDGLFLGIRLSLLSSLLRWIRSGGDLTSRRQTEVLTLHEKHKGVCCLSHCSFCSQISYAVKRSCLPQVL